MLISEKPVDTTADIKTLLLCKNERNEHCYQDTAALKKKERKNERNGKNGTSESALKKEENPHDNMR
jgi:hypothetical protein